MSAPPLGGLVAASLFRLLGLVILCFEGTDGKRAVIEPYTSEMVPRYLIVTKHCICFYIYKERPVQPVIIRILVIVRK